MTTPSTPGPGAPPLEGGLRCRGVEPRSRRPLVTVVTVVRNAAHELEPTLRSVLALPRETVEYVVVDGGSTDGTLDTLRRHEDWIDYWTSAPDRGIYDAMNKGVALARGHFVHFLNVGDTALHLPVDALEQAAAGGADAVSFPVALDGGRLHRPRVGSLLKLDNTLHHQGTFYRRELPPTYDLRFRIFSDFDLNQRIWKAGARIVLGDAVVARHTAGGASHERRGFAEVFAIIRRNFGLPYVVLAYLRFKVLGRMAWLRKSLSSSS
jgi:glycosyltransferase involved in cell wall biosynthesis